MSKEAKTNDHPAILDGQALNQLYCWYQKNRRNLPFRRNREPYTVWVSEVMLQQTRVNAMLPRYKNFVKRFPTIETLATAREEDVLQAWQGLGYYRRARMLHGTAQKIVDEYGRQFPQTKSELLKLPGIGDYTASAIASICFDTNDAVFDGNIRRVLLRILLPECKEDRHLKGLAKRLMQMRGKTSAGLHNQALMELGALVCTPGIPDCPSCPMRKFCYATKKGGPELASLHPPKKLLQKKDILWTHFVICDASRNGIVLVRDPDSRFLRDQWFFPNRIESLEIESLEEEGYETPELPAFIHAATERIVIPTEYRHTITNHRILCRIHILFAKSYDLPLIGPDKQTRMQWKNLSLAQAEEVTVSSAMQKTMRILKRFLQDRAWPSDGIQCETDAS